MLFNGKTVHQFITIGHLELSIHKEHRLGGRSGISIKGMRNSRIVRGCGKLRERMKEGKNQTQCLLLCES